MKIREIIKSKVPLYTKEKYFDLFIEIICNLKYQIKLMQINKFKECRYQTIQTEMDNSLNDVFAPINKEEKKNKEKVKKKRIFSIFNKK